MVQAIAQAIGAIAGTVGTFKKASSDRYNLTKGMEKDAVDFEHNKTLAAYTGVADTRKIVMYAIVALLIGIMIYITMNKNN